jgi:eukaryotic-like serine/threonine-protein kinase
MKPDELIEDRYRLAAPLGRGGMAEVWRAVDERLQRPVAIKFLTSRYAEDAEFLVRFFSEAQAVAGISHHHVVRVLDFGMSEAGPFLVMELVDGGSLCGRIGAPLAIGEAFRLVREAAEGAGAAHERGIVHRDLKPGNILLTGSGAVKLADFGIATLGSIDHMAITGTAIGSPNYISPEGARGEGATPASDVYSLGVVLYELLTGRRPFQAGSATAIALAHVESEPEAPSVHRPDLPAWVDALVLTCLAKDPQARYADGDELAAALRAGEAGAPVAAATESDSNRSRRSPRPLTASLVTAAVLALGGFLLASSGPPVTPSAEAEAETSEPTGRARPRLDPSETSSPAAADASTAATDAGPSPSPTATKGEERDTRATSGDDRAEQGDVPRDAEPEPEDTAPPEEEEPVPEESEPAPEETPVEEEPTPAPAEGPDQQEATIDV